MKGTTMSKNKNLTQPGNFWMCSYSCLKMKIFMNNKMQVHLYKVKLYPKYKIKSLMYLMHLLFLVLFTMYHLKQQESLLHQVLNKECIIYQCRKSCTVNSYQGHQKVVLFHTHSLVMYILGQKPKFQCIITVLNYAKLNTQPLHCYSCPPRHSILHTLG